MKKFDFPPEISRALDALGQEKRREIIRLISNKKRIFFSELVENTKLTSSTISFHLKELMKASLINNYYTKPENPGGKYSYYKLTEFGKDFCNALDIK